MNPYRAIYHLDLDPEIKNDPIITHQYQKSGKYVYTCYPCSEIMQILHKENKVFCSKCLCFLSMQSMHLFYPNYVSWIEK